MKKSYFSLNTALLFLFVLILPYIHIFAQENQDTADKSVVSAIKIEGLEKTKESYMQSVLAKYAGIPESSLDLHEVKISLEELDIFSETDVSLTKDENGKTVLLIKVEEKVSFIPIPFFMYSTSTGCMGGAFVIDGNAFGVGGNYIMGGVFSKDLQLGVLAYRWHSRNIKHPGFSFSISFDHSDKEEKNLFGDNMLEYSSTGGSVYASINDKITEHSLLNTGFRYNYVNVKVDNEYARFRKKLKSVHTFTPGIDWNLTFSSLNDWFLSMKSFNIDGEISILSSGDISKSISLQLSLQHPLPVTRFRMITQYAIYWSENIPIPLRPSQTVVGTTIMPDKFHGTKMGGVNLGLEAGVVNTEMAVFSVYGIFEQFAGKDFNGNFVMNFGYSAGSKMYLRKLAFPAIAIGISHNLILNEIKFSATVGMGGF